MLLRGVNNSFDSFDHMEIKQVAGRHCLLLHCFGLLLKPLRSEGLV